MLKELWEIDCPLCGGNMVPDSPGWNYVECETCGCMVAPKSES